ncbi:uncharacterized protein LOC141652990 [Silene latifolia]|uniref:uncharacterized protein LOC141652990 n=1 Tax=Silene latifolia TaxID=37657 RepID=UPI003D780CF6
MIELFLSKPIWGDDPEQRIALFDELETVIWGVMTSEGRSEARLWLCEAISSLNSITPREQRDLFMSLLRSKPRKWDLAEQVLQLIIADRPHEAGAILAKKSHRLEKFFQGHPRRMMQWFSTFSTGIDSAHGKGAKALSQFAFINRDICWEELEWKGKHGQSPAVVATKPHYFLDLDVQQTVENFVENVPEFWTSKEFAESLKDGEIFSIDKTYFIDFFIDLMYEDDLREVWEVIDQFLVEKSFSYLCQHLLIILHESDLSLLLRKLQKCLSGSKEPVNFDGKSYWLDILIHKCGDRISIDELLLLNALFNKGRQLLRVVGIEEASGEKLKISDLASSIWTKTSEAEGLTPISKYHFKSKAKETMKWLGLLSWCLLYRLSKECHDSETWKAMFISNKIGFRNSDAYRLVEGNDTSEDSESEKKQKRKKRKQKSRKKRKKNVDHDMFHAEELLDLDDADDKPIFQSSSTSWFLSTDDYASSWTLADMPEHLSKHCLKEWMKRTFSNWINAT